MEANLLHVREVFLYELQGVLVRKKGSATKNVDAREINPALF